MKIKKNCNKKTYSDLLNASKKWSMPVRNWSLTIS